MNILFYDMGSYVYKDLLFYLQQAGCHCDTITYHFTDKFSDVFFSKRFIEKIKDKHYDAVLSINFFPIISQICHSFHTKYISWCYDSPLEERFMDYFEYDTNYIFLFDRIEVNFYKNAGYTHIYHLPLAVNTKRISSLKFSSTQIASWTSDVSFVGRLYTSPLDVLLKNVDTFTRGYIEGIMQAQLRVYGYYFIDELITDDLLNTLNTTYKQVDPACTVLNRRGLSFAIAAQITHIERSFLLEHLGSLYNTCFYSTEKSSFSSPVKCMGPLKYYTQMPGVFRNSKLNLCPTLKSIQSGIPLRALDILGSQGVLLSNYQPELAENFIDGTDIIMYESMEDAFEKTEYYLRNNTRRLQIAQNGYRKVCQNFSYPDRLKYIFQIAGLN